MAHFREKRTPHLFYLSFVLVTLSSLQAQSQETPTPLVSTDPTYYYNLCAPSTCGNLSLHYPYGLSTPCHFWPRKAICKDNKTYTWSNPLNPDPHRILSANYTDPAAVTSVVAPEPLFTCGSQISRPNYRNSAASVSLPATYTVGTHFNCTAPIPPNLKIYGLQNSSCLGCVGQDPFNICYYAPGYSLRAPNCETFDVITLGGPPNATRLKDLRAFLRLGFEITFTKPINCVGCQASGGRCGVNPLSGNPICFCPSSAHQMNCTDGMIEDLSTWLNWPKSGKSGPSRLVIMMISYSISILVVMAMLQFW